MCLRMVVIYIIGHIQYFLLCSELRRLEYFLYAGNIPVGDFFHIPQFMYCRFHSIGFSTPVCVKKSSTAIDLLGQRSKCIIT